MINQTLRVYEKNTGNKYFFIRKELQGLFDGLETFTIVCGHKRYPNKKITLKSNGGSVSYFIFVHELFNDCDQIRKKDEIRFTIEDARLVLHL